MGGSTLIAIRCVGEVPTRGVEVGGVEGVVPIITGTPVAEGTIGTHTIAQIVNRTKTKR